MINCGIDVGTNTVRMLIARVEQGKILEVLHSQRAITRLGANIASTGLLSPEGVEQTLALLVTFRQLIAKYKVENVFAAATSAVREARDSAAFLEATHKIGIALRPISGEEEAKYAYMGIASAMNLKNKGSVVIYDIGGGSTETSLIQNSGQIYSGSIPIGVVKLSDKFGFGGINTRTMQNDCAAYIRAVMSDTFTKIKAFEPRHIDSAIGTAGTVTTIAACDLKMKVYDPARINGHIITQIRLEDMLCRMEGLSTKEILTFDGVEKGREDLMVPGILLMLEILRGIGSTESVVSDSGLREGLTLAALP